MLRVGEQLKNLSTALQLGHQNQNFPYQVQYSEFVGGPPMLQAFEGGSIDVGFIQSTPLIFAQAAEQHVTAVAGWATPVARTRWSRRLGQHSIKSWAGLKGKRVAFQEGTAPESALLEGLKSAGLCGLHDITIVNLPTTQVAAALQGGFGRRGHRGGATPQRLPPVESDRAGDRAPGRRDREVQFIVATVRPCPTRAFRPRWLTTSPA